MAGVTVGAETAHCDCPHVELGAPARQPVKGAGGKLADNFFSKKCRFDNRNVFVNWGWFH